MINKKIIIWFHQLRPAFLASFLKKVLFIRRENLNTPYGTFFIDPCSNFGYALIINEIYEPETVKNIKDHLRPDDTFVDLGANEGFFSIIASNIVGDGGRVFSVEPQSRSVEIIKNNLALNKRKNVNILPVAISDKSTNVRLYLSPDINSGSSSLIKPTFYPLPTQQAKAISLSEMFSQQDIQQCDLLKIDIEGWEYDAILGSPDLFKEQRIKAIILQLHPAILAKRGLPAQKIFNFLLSCGYNTTDRILFFLH